MIIDVSFSANLVTGRIYRQRATKLNMMEMIFSTSNVLPIIVSSGIGVRQPKTQRDAKNVSRNMMSHLTVNGLPKAPTWPRMSSLWMNRTHSLLTRTLKSVFYIAKQVIG